MNNSTLVARIGVDANTRPPSHLAPEPAQTCAGARVRARSTLVARIGADADPRPGGMPVGRP